MTKRKVIHKGIEAVPFAHADLDTWRHNFTGVRYLDPKTNFLVFGSVDDVWQKKDGELIVLDYKATWTSKEFSWDDHWKQAWKRQLEVYQWLFRKNGFKVSKTGYFVYCTVDSSVPSFDKKLQFDMTLQTYEGDDSWIDPTLAKARECLSQDKIPKPALDCDYCAYRKASAQLAKKHS